MSYFAAAAARGSGGWVATELDLTGAADIDEVADRLREVDAEADVSLLFVEADDTYLVVLRLDEGEDLRVFGSDSVFAEESRLGALLLGEVEEPALEIDDAVPPPAADEPDPVEDSFDDSVAGAVDDPTAADEPAEIAAAGDPTVDPVGDPDLLADLGVPAHRLLELCAHEGMLPADVTAEVCQIIGCGDEVEELREA